MSEAREAILARTRAALRDAGAPEPAARAYRRAGARDTPARLDLLVERLVDYRAHVKRTSESALRGLIDDIVGNSRIGVPTGLPTAWRPANAVEDSGLGARALDGLDGVVTGCTVAVAETGTLILSGGAKEGRRALTLVPDLHVCVVGVGQIVETVPEAFDALRGLERRPLTFVSGPSATSDIELRRVEGVHGPRTLVVLIVEEA